MASDMKLRMARVVYEMLATTKPEDIRARDVAKACGCTATTIYRHYKSLDHLVLFAAVGYLDEYILAVDNIAEGTTDPWLFDHRTWGEFTKFAFGNVPVFEMLFWGGHDQELSNAIIEYAQIDPDRWVNLDKFVTMLFFDTSLERRTELVLIRSAVAGYYDMADVHSLAALKCLSFHGVLMRYRDTYRDKDVASEGIALCKLLLESLDNHYLKKEPPRQ